MTDNLNYYVKNQFLSAFSNFNDTILFRMVTEIISKFAKFASVN